MLSIDTQCFKSDLMLSIDTQCFMSDLMLSIMSLTVPSLLYLNAESFMPYEYILIFF